MRLIKKFIEFFTTTRMDAQRRAIEDYLAKSTDLVDLERRQRELTFGKKGWL